MTENIDHLRLSTEVSPYTQVGRLFVELRAKGLSLSGVDLEILKGWEDLQINPLKIIQVMLDMAEECKQENRSFPTSLMSVARQLDRVLKVTEGF